MRVPKYLRKKKSRIDRRGRHTKEDRIAKRKAVIQIDPQSCRKCNSVLDPAIRTEEGDALVCKYCALVDDRLCFDYETPMLHSDIHTNVYRHKNYFAERLLQARDKEPRFTDKELDLFSSVYDIYRLQCPLLWSEEKFTKKHAARICRLIVKHYPRSTFRRRLERWYQYRNYICGKVNNELPLDIANALKILFDAYSHYFLVYISENKLCRRNITQLDLVILVLLYNLGPEVLAAHGWYFLNHNIMNKTLSTRLDMIRIKAICNLINSNILHMKPSKNISPDCFAWFRSGNILKVPSITTLLNHCMTNPMAYYQFLAYKGNNHLLHLYPSISH